MRIDLAGAVDGRGASRIAYIFSAAAMPPMAVWKNEPSVRMGMKNSLDKNTMENAAGERRRAARELPQHGDHAHRPRRRTQRRSMTVT